MASQAPNCIYALRDSCKMKCACTNVIYAWRGVWSSWGLIGAGFRGCISSHVGWERTRRDNWSRNTTSTVLVVSVWRFPSYWKHLHTLQWHHDHQEWLVPWRFRYLRCKSVVGSGGLAALQVLYILYSYLYQLDIAGTFQYMIVEPLVRYIGWILVSGINSADQLVLNVFYSLSPACLEPMLYHTPSCFWSLQYCNKVPLFLANSFPKFLAYISLMDLIPI